MAPERPNLVVAAQPISTFVAPVAAAAELYDQQSVNLALQFSEAFKDLSLTAANFAAVLKKEDNKEQLEAGIDLVNQNQKSYAQLVESGQIKPSENPWLAVGAQQASGQIEGSKARAEFTALYNKQAEEDPTFFDNPDKFNVLAASYAENRAQDLKAAPYMSRAFFESLDPYVGSMRLKHEEQIVEARNKKAIESLGGAVADAVENYASPEPSVSSLSIPALQEYMDDMGRKGFNLKTINLTVAEQLINQMETSDNPDRAKEILEGLKAGTGRLVDIPAVKTAMLQRQSKIEANRNRLTAAEVDLIENTFFGFDGVVDQVVSGRLTLDEGKKKWTEFANSDQRKVTITPAQYEETLRRIPAVVASRQDALERKKAKDDFEAVFAMTETLSNQIGAGLSEAEAKDANLTRILSEAEARNIPPTERFRLSQTFESLWDRNAKQRALYRLEERQRVLWDGINDQQPGLIRQYSDEASVFFTGKGMDGKPLKDASGRPQRDLPLPKVMNFKASIDAELAAMGVTPQNAPEEVKDAYARAQMKFNSVIDAQLEGIVASNPNYNKTLDPLPTDAPDIVAQKADLRTKATLLRMQMGVYFENHTEASRLSKAFMTNLSATAEEIPWQMEDTLRAYQLARLNNLPVETVLGPSPGSGNGKAMISILDWMVSELQTTNASPMDVIKDAASRQFFGWQMHADLFDPKNPLASTDFNTTGIDPREYEQAFANMRTSLNITNADSIPFALSVYRGTYYKTLEQTHQHSAALNAAQKAVKEGHMVVRGSLLPQMMIPNQKNPSQAMPATPAYIEAWLDMNFPGQNATLVVVATKGRNQPIMAVRTPTGLTVPGSRASYEISDLEIPDKELPKVIEYMKKVDSRSALKRIRDENPFSLLAD